MGWGEDPIDWAVSAPGCVYTEPQTGGTGLDGDPENIPKFTVPFVVFPTPRIYTSVPLLIGRGTPEKHPHGIEPQFPH